MIATRAVSALLLWHVAIVSGQACSDACSFASDGECDDGGAGSGIQVCPLGSDCTDCGTRTSISTHCTCANIDAFMAGGVVNSPAGSEAACDNARAGCSVSSWSCSLSSSSINGRVTRTITHSCVGAALPTTTATASPTSGGGNTAAADTASTEASTSSCDGMPSTSHCCKDGTPDDYPCPATYSCAKGSCLAATYKLCTDDPTGVDYACAATYSCGRGSCVAATYTLCGTSGTKTCAATYTCCGTSAATKNSDMVCNSVMDKCPDDRLSDTSYYAAPYEYSGGSDDSTSSDMKIGPVIGGVGERRPCTPRPPPASPRTCDPCEPVLSLRRAPRAPQNSWRPGGLCFAGWRRRLPRHANEEEERGRRPSPGRRRGPEQDLKRKASAPLSKGPRPSRQRPGGRRRASDPALEDVARNRRMNAYQGSGAQKEPFRFCVDLRCM